MLLEEPIKPDDWDSVIKAKKYYNSCMDLEMLEKVYTYNIHLVFLKTCVYAKYILWYFYHCRMA